jgi:sugar lactone lactonase YvrE
LAPLLPWWRLPDNQAENTSRREEEMRIEVLADVKTTLGEGPLWDVEEQRLHWIDSFDGRFIAGSMDTMKEGSNANLYRLDPDLFSQRRLPT